MFVACIINRRLSVISLTFLIYDLIASTEMNFVNARDFHNFDKSSYVIFMTTDGDNCCSMLSSSSSSAVATAAIAAAAINESVIDIGQNENQMMPATNPYRNERATFESHDLFSIMPTTQTTTMAAPTMTTTGMTTSNSSTVVAMMSASTSSSASSTVSFSAASSSASLSPLAMQTHWQRVLSRPKRYLSFPEGASLSVAVCFTVGIIGNPRYNYMAFGLNWGTAYDLPNITWVLNHLHGFARHPVPATVLRRRTRRALYKEIENVVEFMGYNGRDCVLRALCESRQYFQKTKMGMLGEMLRVIFSLPKQRIFTRELSDYSDIEHYDHAYRKARSVDCAEQYDCAFSLLELAFGKYSTPPPGYFDNH